MSTPKILSMSQRLLTRRIVVPEQFALCTAYVVDDVMTLSSMRCTVSRCSATMCASCEKIWPSSLMVDSIDSMAVLRCCM